MLIPTPKVVTEPYSLIGYALFLLFGLATLLLRKNQKKHQWVIPVGVGLAVLCIAGGLALAWKRESHPALPQSESPRQPSQPSSQSMTIGPIKQDVTCGNAVAGVQGSVTNEGQTCQQQNPKQKGPPSK